MAEAVGGEHLALHPSTHVKTPIGPLLVVPPFPFQSHALHLPRAPRKASANFQFYNYQYPETGRGRWAIFLTKGSTHDHPVIKWWRRRPGRSIQSDAAQPWNYDYLESSYTGAVSHYCHYQSSLTMSTKFYLLTVQARPPQGS